VTKLSTRSYLVLGLLAIDDWTTYELARQMERGFGDIWPSSRSMVYEEPKALVAAGLARATTERIGERSRTRYGITAAGRKALKRWLAEPGAAPAMHFEGLLKVLLADPADRASIAASLTEAKEWAIAMRETGRGVAAEYAEGRGPFQDRIDVVSASFAFLWDFANLVERWADWAGDDTVVRTEVFTRALEGQHAVDPAPPG
jgi:PadR family transcriptional regulator, regulatory protein AphA